MAAAAVSVLAEHPAVVHFRWGAAELSTWPSLVAALLLFLAVVSFLSVVLSFVGVGLPLGPLPFLHSFAMAAASLVIFLGEVVSTAAEIRDVRWSWRGRIHRTSSLQWLLCFPPGTRPSGRVFFWSYAFYLSRYFQLLHGLMSVAARRRYAAAAVFAQAAAVVAAFLWLEFTQSFQVIAILAATAADVAAFGYRVWAGGAGGGRTAAVAVVCQAAVCACNLACHLGVAWLHVAGGGGGCSGAGAWASSAVLNAVLLWVFLRASRSGAGAAAGGGETKKES